MIVVLSSAFSGSSSKLLKFSIVAWACVFFVSCVTVCFSILDMPFILVLNLLNKKYFLEISSDSSGRGGEGRRFCFPSISSSVSLFSLVCFRGGGGGGGGDGGCGG